MLHKYKRAARSHAELGLGPLAPLCEAIPELACMRGAREPDITNRNRVPEKSSSARTRTLRSRGLT